MGKGAEKTEADLSMEKQRKSSYLIQLTGTGRCVLLLMLINKVWKIYLLKVTLILLERVLAWLILGKAFNKNRLQQNFAMQLTK